MFTLVGAARRRNAIARKSGCDDIFINMKCTIIIRELYDNTVNKIYSSNLQHMRVKETNLQLFESSVFTLFKTMKTIRTFLVLSIRRPCLTISYSLAQNSESKRYSICQERFCCCKHHSFGFLWYSRRMALRICSTVSVLIVFECVSASYREFVAFACDMFNVSNIISVVLRNLVDIICGHSKVLSLQ